MQRFLYKDMINDYSRLPSSKERIMVQPRLSLQEVWRWPFLLQKHIYNIIIERSLVNFLAAQNTLWSFHKISYIFGKSWILYASNQVFNQEILITLQHTNDFPLYTEAIKFFNHSESMVRIAVRTLTLNVYKVEDESMLRFVIDKTAVPYFANLVWFIGNHILEIDACVRHDAE